MKTAISIPDPLFRRVDAHAQRLNLSRSEFFARAAARLADELDGEQITAAINTVLAAAPTESDDPEFFTEAARQTIRRAASEE